MDFSPEYDSRRQSRGYSAADFDWGSDCPERSVECPISARVGVNSKFAFWRADRRVGLRDGTRRILIFSRIYIIERGLGMVGECCLAKFNYYSIRAVKELL